MTETMKSSRRQVTSSSSADLRKIKKPIIERKRRERINFCLNELKSMVLEAKKKHKSCYAKMEKADILEMTVAHLRHLAKQRLLEAGIASKAYQQGFNLCLNQVVAFLKTSPLFPSQASSTLLRRLHSMRPSAEQVPLPQRDSPTTASFSNSEPEDAEPSSTRLSPENFSSNAHLKDIAADSTHLHRNPFYISKFTKHLLKLNNPFNALETIESPRAYRLNDTNCNSFYSRPKSIDLSKVDLNNNLVCLAPSTNVHFTNYQSYENNVIEPSKLWRPF